MRIAPTAMIFAHQSSATGSVFQMAKEAAWITHGHASGFLSAGAFAVILHSLLVDESILDGVSRARSLLEHESDSSECIAAMDVAVRLAEYQPGNVAALTQIGEGWVGEEALGIALYCALTARDFAAGVRMAVNHGGDSDTTGSLTGQLLGALYGLKAIPAHWLGHLELRELISLVAQDLIECHLWNLDDDGNSDLESIWDRYPGG
jgi:ADP-ribosylglycohydrolase